MPGLYGEPYQAPNDHSTGRPLWSVCSPRPFGDSCHQEPVGTSGGRSINDTSWTTAAPVGSAQRPRGWVGAGGRLPAAASRHGSSHGEAGEGVHSLPSPREREPFFPEGPRAREDLSGLAAHNHTLAMKSGLDIWAGKRVRTKNRTKELALFEI